jgi:hypothetical protein
MFQPMGEFLQVAGIFLSLALLIALAYRGISVIILAPVLALLAVLLSGDGHQLLAVYTQVFMCGVLGFVVKYFPVFLLGALFGKLMEDSGSAQTIAHAIVHAMEPRRVVLAVVISDYEALMTRILPMLTADRLPLAVELAAMPETVRGFGHVKLRNVEAMKARREELLERLDDAGEAVAEAARTG